MSYVGVDIQANRIKAKVFSVKQENGNFVFDVMGEGPEINNVTAIGNPELHVENITTAIAEAISNAGIDKKKIIAIGLGHCGLLNFDAGEIDLSFDLRMAHVPIVKPLKKAFSAPVFLYHDVASWALYENVMGAGNGRGFKDFMYVLGAYAIGSSIYRDEVLDTRAGEFGFSVVDSDYLQNQASRYGISLKIEQTPNNDIDDIYLRKRNVPMNILNSALASGNRVVTRIMTRAAQQIGESIATQINNNGHSAVILGGELFKGNDLMFAEAKATAEQFALDLILERRGTVILEGQNHPDGALYGSVLFAIDQLQPRSES